MSTELSIGRILGFKDFFPSEKPETKEFYAAKLGKEFLYKFSCHFLSFFKFPDQFPQVDQLLKEWFTFNEFKFDQSPSYHIVRDRLEDLKKQFPRQRLDILHTESFLKLFTWLSTEKNLPENVGDLDASSAILMFKLYLLFNEELLTSFQVATDSVKAFKGEREIQRQILAMSFPQHDFVNVDFAQLMTSQCFKAIKLLDFMESNPKYHKLYNEFLNYYNLPGKQDYIQYMLPAVMPGFMGKKPGWTVLSLKNQPDPEKSAAFLDKLSFDPDDKTLFEQNDYLQLRSNPLQKLSKDEYRIIFDLFLVKKIYNGLYFKLSAIDQANKKEHKEKGVDLLFEKDFPGSFKNEFSEGVLVYDILNEIYSGKKINHFTGDQFKAIPLEREPDYYLCNSKDMLLFESKDFFIRGDIKLSYDFNQIEGALRNNRLEKAVTQLSTNIKRALDQQLVLDKNYDPSDINIFPVILVHDSLYSTPALNYWVEYWLRDEIEKWKKEDKYAGIDFSRIFPVTIIEVDTLILFMNALKNDKLDLFAMVKAYHDHVSYHKKDFKSTQELEKHARQSALSFSEFSRDYCHQMGIKFDISILLGMFRKYGIKEK